MIKHFSFACFCLFIPGLLSCQGKPPSGLVAHYTFDGNSEDHSGNGNHGIIEGATTTSDRFGHENSAYRFDGLTAIIYARVKGMPAVDSPQSFSWWYQVDGAPSFLDERGADNMIALVDSSGGIGIQFGFRAPGYESLGFDSWNWGGGTLLEAERPAPGQWHHCVYTYDGNIHRFYIDGAEVSHSSADTQAGTPTLLMIGNYPGGDQFFEGKMDDVRIYNRKLEQSETHILYKEGD